MMNHLVQGWCVWRTNPSGHVTKSEDPLENRLFQDQQATVEVPPSSSATRARLLDHRWSPHRTEPVVTNFQTQHPSETRRHILCRLKNGLKVRHFCHCDSRHSWLNIWSAPAGYFRNNRKATCSPGRRLTGPIHPVIWHSVWSTQPQGGEKGLDHA